MLPDQEIILRLCVAAILGGLVGLERERLEWAAGLRTHMVVCVGAALMMIVSAFGFADILGTPNVALDPSRVAAQVVSGIGFLGAGTILFLRQEVIRGLTTAASLWTVAGVGLAVGGGMYVAAITATALVVLILAGVRPLERRMFRRDRIKHVSVLIDRQHVSLLRMQGEIESSGAKVQQIALKMGDTPDDDRVDITFLRGIPKEAMLDMAMRLKSLEGVRSVNL
ncbi:MAG TPA: MgtC/SapB family protein [Oxalicibacterium sp.]|jgi:putative Mg2+ transporter-C (MgtC) family protein|nr:MgtC/SapB family protein [Oxalicibacterium sp.]